MATRVKKLFDSIDDLLSKYKLKQNCDAIIIDLHGETASEKQAFANYIDGKATAVIGTHTHVPTSDLRILPKASEILLTLFFELFLKNFNVQLRFLII